MASPLTRRIWLLHLVSLLLLAAALPGGSALRGAATTHMQVTAPTPPTRPTDGAAIPEPPSPHAARAEFLQSLAFVVLIATGASLVVANLVLTPCSDLAKALSGAGGPTSARSAQVLARLASRRDDIGELARTTGHVMATFHDTIAAQERFAADVAHEFRNPLSSLRLAAGGLRKAQDAAQIACLLDIIEHDVSRLDRLLTDAEKTSSLGADLLEAEKMEFDLTHLLGTLCNHLALQARMKGVDFIRFLPEDPVRVLGLEGRMAQVFVNLIANAISFCNAGDAVRVRAIRRENRVLVAVEDTGPGLPDSALEKVFARFYSERPAHEFGTHSGLGLAISQQIIKAHQGVIWAENIRVHEAEAGSPPLGARFVVGLPVWAGQ